MPRFNPFAGSFGKTNWLMPVSAMSLVLGFMVATAWVTESNRTGRAGFLGPDQRQRVSANTVDVEDYANLQTEVAKLRKDNTKLQNAVATRGIGEKTLNDALQEAKVFAGLTPVEGPGIILTLADQPSGGGKRPGLKGFQEVIPDDVIHDLDILRVVNELYASGAEAVSVNGFRCTAGTWIRCAGPTVLVDSNRLASPFVIQAIGDQKTLMGGLNLPRGILDEIRENSAAMVKLETASLLRLPAYAGATGRKLVRVPKETK